jgi:F-type H+-transporting ATPase subunit epsilon
MEKLFNLYIVSPGKIEYEGAVSSLIAPATLGYLGVLANHAPLVAGLTGGKIIVKEKSGETKIFYSDSKGFLEVLRNNVTLILSAALSSQNPS